jgi:hypothetical protein
MQISERVRLVGSGELGFQTSHLLDCNVFLLDGRTEHALIDAGSGVEPERVVANVERAGVPTDRVKRLLLTHAHGDHAAGARFFRDRLGVEVTCPEEAAPWLEQGDLEKPSLRLAKEASLLTTLPGATGSLNMHEGSPSPLLSLSNIAGVAKGVDWRQKTTAHSGPRAGTGGRAPQTAGCVTDLRGADNLVLH